EPRPCPTEALVHALEDVATRLRIDSIRARTAARSGHPTSAASAADIVAALFFSVMRFDPENPRAVTCNRFVLSKGHAAPLLYAAWAAVASTSSWPSSTSTGWDNRARRCSSGASTPTAAWRSVRSRAAAQLGSSSSVTGLGGWRSLDR